MKIVDGSAENGQALPEMPVRPEAELPYRQFLCRPEDVQLTEAQLSTIDGWYQASQQPYPHHPAEHIDKSDYLAAVKRWLTGNYDPDTGLHTFYRYVGQPAVDSLNSSGSLTTRVVQNFGDGSDLLAVERLDRITRGHTTGDDEHLIQRLLLSRDKSAFTDGYGAYSTEEVRSKLKSLAAAAHDDIIAALEPSASGLYGRVVDVIQGSASPVKGSLFELFHSMIHATTEPNEVSVASGSEFRIAIHARPGAFMPGGTFIGEEFVDNVPSDEWEWSAFGAFYPTAGESIDVERIN